jgi:putative flavoprotein involved in K+ transport
MKDRFDCIVIGAGQAGLSSAYHLENRNLKYVVLEASDQSAGSWPNYYDSLTLFSPARYSSLPGLTFPGEPNHYPTKKEVISYLTSYADHFNLKIRTNEKVVSVKKIGSLFELNTEKGNVYTSRTVITATGAFAFPYIPEIAGSLDFKGKILHSSQYRNVEGFENERIIVVGGGNSAVQIAYELSKVADVTLATRSPINFVPQIIAGKDIHFWVKLLGIDHFTFGKKFANSTSVLDTGVYEKAVSNKQPDQRNMFKAFTDEGVVWNDDKKETVNSVIFATGYRHNVQYLKHIPHALDSYDIPVHKNGLSNTTEGLGYVGLSGQRSFSSATIRGVGRDAKYVVNQLQRFLQIYHLDALK